MYVSNSINIIISEWLAKPVNSNCNFIYHDVPMFACIENSMQILILDVRSSLKIVLFHPVIEKLIWALSSYFSNGRFR